MENQLVNVNSIPVLFSQFNADLILTRIDQLFPYSPAQNGKTNAAQMLAFCANTIEMALGEYKQRRPFAGLFLGRFFRSEIHTNRYQVNQYPNYVLPKDFDKEKERLTKLIQRFVGDIPAKFTTHPFLGQQSLSEWETSIYRHLDYHLQQFGV